MYSRTSTTRNRLRTRGFTLVEVVIVVLILGILGTVAVGKFRYTQEDVLEATLRTNLDNIYDAIDLNSPGKLPSSIPADWFVAARIPRHPQASGSAWIQVDSTPNKTEPTAKVLTASLAHYWYNPTNGIVRARVGIIGSEPETLEFYNLVNDSESTSLGNFSSGGGGGGS